MRKNSFLTDFIAYWLAARARRVAARELAAMSACELGDMGITRLDASRLFEPRLMPEFRSRGGVSTTATFRPRSQRSAVMTNLESLA